MNCEETKDRVDDYEDGLLPEASFQEVELHLSTCASCREEASRLHDLVLLASRSAKEMKPSRDLWPGVLKRLSVEGDRKGRRAPFPSAALAAAAVVVVALLSVLLRSTPAGSPPSPQPQEAASRPSSEHVLEAEVDYVRATGQLTEALRARKGSLSPQTQASIDENLRVIDEALRQVRGALEKDPGNQQLTRLLASTHQKKLDLLLRLLKLSAEI